VYAPLTVMRTLSLSLSLSLPFSLAHTCFLLCLLNISKYTTFKPITQLVLLYIHLAMYLTLPWRRCKNNFSKCIKAKQKKTNIMHHFNALFYNASNRNRYFLEKKAVIGKKTSSKFSSFEKINYIIASKICL